MNKVTLGDAVTFSDKRIDVADLSIENYIGTDNILQNKEGKKDSSYVPTSGKTAAYKAGDILIANIRPYLKKIWFATNEGGSSADVTTLRGKAGFDPKFVYYNLFQDEFFDYAMKGAKGSKMPRLDKKQILNFPILAPDLSTQKSIARTLSLLDNKIALNRRINAKLETLARELYNFWFVQFDFPDTNNRPYKTAGGAMVFNEELKREIPAGWTVKSLVDIESNIVTGKTPNTVDSNNFGGNVPFVTIDDIRSNLFVTTTARTITEKGASALTKKNIPAGSIFVSCIGTAGLIGFASVESYTNQQINSIVPKHAHNRYYLYFALVNYFQFSSGAKTGNTIPNMSKSDFEQIKLLLPDSIILGTYSRVVEQLFSRIHTAIRESGELTNLRDFLLPILMNRQIEVSD